MRNILVLITTLLIGGCDMTALIPIDTSDINITSTNIVETLPEYDPLRKYPTGTLLHKDNARVQIVVPDSIPYRCDIPYHKGDVVWTIDNKDPDMWSPDDAVVYYRVLKDIEPVCQGLCIKEMHRFADVGQDKCLLLNWHNTDYILDIYEKVRQVPSTNLDIFAAKISRKTSGTDEEHCVRGETTDINIYVFKELTQGAGGKEHGYTHLTGEVAPGRLTASECEDIKNNSNFQKIQTIFPYSAQYVDLPFNGNATEGVEHDNYITYTVTPGAPYSAVTVNRAVGASWEVVTDGLPPIKKLHNTIRGETSTIYLPSKRTGSVKITIFNQGAKAKVGEIIFTNRMIDMGMTEFELSKDRVDTSTVEKKKGGHVEVKQGVILDSVKVKLTDTEVTFTEMSRRFKDLPTVGVFDLYDSHKAPTQDADIVVGRIADSSMDTRVEDGMLLDGYDASFTIEEVS